MDMDNKKITPFRRFLMLLKPDSKEVKNIYVYSIFSGLISMSLPLGIQAIVNLIQGGQINTSWVILVTFVVLGIAISGALQVFQLRIMENLQQKIFTRAAVEFSYRISKIRMEALYKHHAPELMNRFFDVATIQKGLTKILIDFSSAMFIVSFSLILLSFYHSFFILFSILMIMLIYIIFRFTVPKGMETSLQESKFKYKVAHWLEEIARTNISFKLAGNSTLPMEKTDKYVGQYLESRESHFNVLVQQYSLLIVFKVVIAAGLLAMGGILVMEQQMNIGQFVAAEIIILIIMASVEKIILSVDSIYDIFTSLEKVAQVTDLELERSNGSPLDLARSEAGLSVTVKNVEFFYPEASKSTLHNISFAIESGDKWIFEGGNNSGKSTMLSIISGLYEVQEGVILFNGLPIGNLSLNSIRNVIGEYMANDRLFEGTVLENITLGRDNIPFTDVEWAVKNMGIQEFIQNSIEGYNSTINSMGKGLSDSIITKILLARAIVIKPKLLLLENAFEHLDKPNREKIIDFLFKKENHWTIIAVTNNEYFAQKGAKTAVFAGGNIVELGESK